MEDERPLTNENYRKQCCFCLCLSKVLSTRKELQAQRGCGCLGFHPAWLQRLADIRLFVVVIGLYWLIFTTLEYYLVGVITSLEKRFGYSSARSGFLVSIREIAFVLVTTFVSHFTRNLHRPRFLALSGILGAVGGLVFAVPHFVFDRTDVLEIQGKSHLSNEGLTCEFFKNLGKNGTNALCGQAIDNSAYMGSYSMFIIGAIIIGVAMAPMTSLSLTYVDDCAGPKRVAMFLGFMNMMRPLGPVLAFVLGSIFTSKYETLKEPGFDQSDPRWIGAWWIGYLFIPSLLALITAALPLFPHRIPRCPVKDTDYVPPRREQINGHITPPIMTQGSDRGIAGVTANVPRLADVSLSDYFSSLGHLIRNPVYMTLQLGGCLSAFVISGFFTFVPKYFEVMFHLPPSLANIIAGGTSASMAAFGVLTGAIISSKLNWSSRQCALFIFILDLIFAFAVLGLMPVHCPDINLVRTSPANSSCLDSCICQPEQYHPVCGSDNRTYLSPCHAGCTVSHTNSTWSNCACVNDGVVKALSPTGGGAILGNRNSGGAAVSGMCSFGCRQWITYTCLMAVGAFVLMMASVPGTTICLRGVKEEHRALAFGFSGFMLSIASFIPGPLIYGTIVDSTCLVWSEDCGQRAECMLYDQTALRVRINLSTFGFKLLASFFYLALWLILRKQEMVKLQSDRHSIRYYGGNNVIVESRPTRDDNELQLRI